MRTFNEVVVAIAALALIATSVFGCNTVKGAGRDVEKGGKSIQGAADGAQK